MRQFEVYYMDLNEDARRRFEEFVGGRDEIQEFIPIATIESEEDDEDGNNEE